MKVIKEMWSDNPFLVLLMIFVILMLIQISVFIIGDVVKIGCAA